MKIFIKIIKKFLTSIFLFMKIFNKLIKIHKWKDEKNFEEKWKDEILLKFKEK